MLNKDYYYAGYSYADYQLPMNQGRDPWPISSPDLAICTGLFCFYLTHGRSKKSFTGPF